MRASDPTVSVLMPVRNAERFLFQALDSILTQVGVDFEVIVVDDASSDAGPALLAKFSATHRNLRVVTRTERGGISRALNQALEIASGRYVARMDADDISLQGRLEAQVRYLDDHPEVGVVGAQAWTIDSEGRRGKRARYPVGVHRVREALKISCALLHPTVMMRRDLVVSAGGYRPMFDAAEDYDLWLRLAGRTELDNLPTPFLLYRRHGLQQTVRSSFKQAYLSALTQEIYRLHLKGVPDPFRDAMDLKGWRHALGSVAPQAVEQVRFFMAASLADNGGSLSAAGGRCLSSACRAAVQRGSQAVRRRLALACVRHQLQLARSGRPREALGKGALDLLRWKWEIIGAYVRHGAIIWRSTRH